MIQAKWVTAFMDTYNTYIHLHTYNTYNDFTFNRFTYNDNTYNT